ncbi:pyridoxamine 5'-phosphate oxidase family protein [Jannaschia sp. M317]|uniref:FAD-binding oxidoreductase n=1 Tax=Jannaschia sp. M317 TaxID=2867011 RepID=UPI0021A4177F|nr:pyridoxamine 5'-phosphate oxidase family protein [Jannaschia sp. M317]UWQ19877.1 pyridoxamine 5'-phosphate oxidase family protein [Jannaschia sp. M317]
MSATDLINPFHEGERAAQDRAGVGNVAEWAGGFIRDYLPEQHRAFHTSLPFLVVSGGDAAGRTWITLVEGPDGYATSPDPRRVQLDAQLGPDDPLALAFAGGTDIGVLGIELATRRRNRFSGHVRSAGAGYAIDIRQTFGNCPQYIHERAWTRVDTVPGTAAQSAALTADQTARITAADTMFIGSGHQGEAGAASNGYDASHRGGAPGFVCVVDATHLQIPDYAGNNFFNTIGNLVSDPHIGLLFIDFETGGLLHVSGRATIDWDPKGAHDDDAWRMINVEIDAVVDRPSAVSLRWAKQDHLSRRLKLAKRVQESADITSFYFVPADGRPLEPFEAGQHLPIEVQIPGQKGTTKRSYSLSGPPEDRRFYRISVKREDKGLVSRFLHDHLREGSLIEAQAPSGDFVIPCSNCPLVLVSAGVGLTPMLSMLHASADHERPVWYVHGTRSGGDHALRREVAGLVSANPRAAQHIAYSRPKDDDIRGRHYHSEGRITADTLLGLQAGSQAHYMLCGPAAFLADIRNGLEARGVAPEQIHFETFGPTG